MTGIRTFNEAGSVQVSNNTFAMALSASGNLTMVDDNQTHPQPMTQGSISVTGTNPLLAFIPPPGKELHVRRISVSGNSYVFHIVSKSSVPFNFPYWIFDVPSNAIKDQSSAGLRAYDEYEVPTFDAAASTLRIAGYLDPGMPEPTSPGAGALYETAAAITPPPGRTYAVCQSLIAWASTMYTTGYGNGGGPIIRPEEDPGDPGNATQRFMELRSYYLAAGQDFSGNLYGGLREFERFSNWYPLAQQDNLQFEGQTGHLVVDITDFIGGGTSNPNTINVSVSPASGTVSGNGTTISNIVTATVSGGTGSYTFLWERISGSSLVVAHTSVNANNLRTRVDNQPAGTVYEAIWRLRATDSNGNVGYSPDVLFSHTAFTQSIEFDPINPSELNGSTNDNILYQTTTFNITGITENITLRVTGFNYSGNLSTADLVAYKRPIGSSTWTEMGRFTVIGYTSVGNFVDFTVEPNTQIQILADAQTTSGIRSATWTYRIRNITSGTIAADRNVSATVDADNNYNVRYITPNPMYWNNISFTTPNNVGAGTNNYQTFTGINETLDLRLVIQNVSGQADNSQLLIDSNTRGNRGGFSPANAGTYDFNINPNEAIYFYADASTNSGIKSKAYQVALYNLTDSNTLIGYFTVDMTVDNDNNYNLPNYNINYMYFSGLETYPADMGTNSYTGSTVGYVNGSNQPVTLRVFYGMGYHYIQAKAQFGDNQPDNWTFTSSYEELSAYVNGGYRGAIGKYINGSYSGGQNYEAFDIVVNPGDSIQLYIYKGDPYRLGDGYGGTVAHTAGNIILRNLNTGVDVANFNYNLLGYGPDGIRPGGPGGPLI